MFEYLDRRYALALYEVAEEKGKVQEYLNDLREICDLIDNNKDFYEVVKHPQISTKQKKKTFINIFKANNYLFNKFDDIEQLKKQITMDINDRIKMKI